MRNSELRDRLVLAILPKLLTGDLIGKLADMKDGAESEARIVNGFNGIGVVAYSIADAVITAKAAKP